MKKENIRQFIIFTFCIALTAVISTKYFFRIDLSSEKRYTLSAATKNVLRSLDEPLYVNVFLDGELPVQMRKLRNGVREMLDEFKTYSGSRIVVRFFDPTDADDVNEREERYAGLEAAGILRVSHNKTNKDGSQSQQIIFPGAIFSYKDRTMPVNLLNNSMLPTELVLNSSLEALEYELIKTISMLATDSISKLALITGHGELTKAEIYDLGNELRNFYQIDFQEIDKKYDALDSYRAAIIAKPQQPFDEKEKFVIDRYIMRGGKLIWLIDGANVNTDSLFSLSMTLALSNDLNLDDQLFSYGVRINYNVVQDIVANAIPIITSDGSSRATTAPWLYYPLALPSSEHAVTRNLGPVWLRYASEIDTVGSNAEIRKTVLLQTSEMSRTKGLPFMISLDEVQRIPEQFNNPNRIVATLLEGKFQSIFRSRNARNLFPELQETQVEKSVETKMIIVADGDIARNDVRNTSNGIVPYGPLGYDKYSRETFSNKEFLINAVNYLTDDAGLMNLRNREFKIRLLNKQKIAKEQLKWQMINLVFPMLILLAGGFAFNRWRQYHNAK